MRAESTNLPSALLVALYDYAPAVLAHPLVLDLAGDEREQRVIASKADAFARRDLGAALPDKDRARVDDLSAVDLDSEHLRVRVATVARRTAALLVCQLLRLLLGPAPRGFLRFIRLSLINVGRLGRLGLRFGRRFLLWLRLGPTPLRLCGLLDLFLFFCSQAHAPHRDDLECGQVCAPTMVDPHALLRLVAEALYPRPSPVRKHLRIHVQVTNLLPYLEVIAVAEEQDTAELDRRTEFRREAVDQDAIAGHDAVPGAAADDDSARSQGSPRSHGFSL